MAANRSRRGLACALAGLFAGLASVAAARGAEAPTAPAMSPIDYTQPGTALVAVAGARRLNLRCLGTGAPTVVLDAGAANFSYTWRFVQPAIARFTRVCSYDRAGYGFSDPNERPATAANIVDDLHTALAKAGIAPPFVLVGQWAGGLYATLYADMYLPDVVGMVLVDPGFASQSTDDYAVALRSPDELAKERKEKADFRALLSRCADSARAKTFAAGKDACPCGPASLDGPAFAAYLGQYCAEPKHYEALLAEDAALLGVPGGRPHAIREGRSGRGAPVRGDATHLAHPVQRLCLRRRKGGPKDQTHDCLAGGSCRAGRSLSPRKARDAAELRPHDPAVAA